MNVLITGGASGLGEAITSKLAKDKNMKIYFTFCNSDEAALKIEADNANASAIKCNFRNEADVESLSKKIDELDLDVLINNAYTGHFIRSHFHKTAPSDFITEFKENIFPVICITQAAIAAFRKKKSGKIVTILTSALLDVPPIGTSVYTANKAYLQQLVKTWAAENGKFNIFSNSVSPSFMLTNMTKEMDERIIEQLKENQPLKRFLTPAEVAEAIKLHLNSSSHVNGADIAIGTGQNIS